VFCDVAEVEGEVVGVAVWFLSFSTWLGRHGIYLEDLYVTPSRRSEGHGKALLATLARRCVERGYGRLEWSVLDWNTPAIDFYIGLGAVGMGGWPAHRSPRWRPRHHPQPARSLPGSVWNASGWSASPTRASPRCTTRSPEVA